MNQDYTFRFLSYYFDKASLTATFVYQGIDNYIFSEHITFDRIPKNKGGGNFNPLNDPTLDRILDNACFMAFIILGTSYFKAHPTPYIKLDKPIDAFQAGFFNQVYQEGLSQYAYENGLNRNNLAHFNPTEGYKAPRPDSYKHKGNLVLQSGGKDSLLVATLCQENNIDFTPWYVSSSEDGSHPDVIDNLYPGFEHRKAQIARRSIDLFHLQQSGGLNGHVPVTYINQSLALIQAILNGDDTVMTSIGQEGTEPVGYIGDLAVNHQWSKTLEAEQIFSEYVHKYISPDLHVGSPIRKYSELRVSELFVEKCWQRYGYAFSSCNQANYKQRQKNGALSWCGECAKCANTYLLFCPFLAPQALQSLFSEQDLFLKPSLTDAFKGLLGVENQLKPFECVGSYDELRFAYHHRAKVPPIKVPAGVSVSQSGGIVDNISQATKRLGLDKLFSKEADVTYGPDGNYGQIQAAKRVAEAAERAKNPNYGQPEMIQPLYADLPFHVPGASPSFDFRAEFPSDPYFAKMF